MSTAFIVLMVVIVLTFGWAWFFGPVGWRTRIFNWLSIGSTVIWTGVTYLFPALDGVDLSGFLAQKEAAFATFLIAVGNAILREVTTTPPGKQD
jgi:hypothetical protein